jgi:hypothetical protein
MAGAIVRVRANHSSAPIDPIPREAQMEVVSNGEQTAATSDVLRRTAMATALVVVAIAALATTSLVQSNGRATAQSSGVTPAAPSVASVPLYIPLDSGEVSRFAFGHFEFDWDPAGGVPGFGSWPLGTPRQ